MSITLVGTQHHEPLLEGRMEDVLADQDFDSVFVEGVDQDSAEVVEKYVDRWLENLEAELGFRPDVETPDGRLRETDYVDESFDGNVYYLDSGKTAFENVKDNVSSKLLAAERGELKAGPEKLISPQASQQDFEAVLRMYMPDPDIPYQIISGQLDEEEYQERLTEALVELYEEINGPADGEVRERLTEKVRDQAPDQDRMYELLVDQVYEKDNEQDREREWVETFMDNYDGENTAVFVGFAHLDDERDTFYTKLQAEGYDSERRSLKEFEPVVN